MAADGFIDDINCLINHWQRVKRYKMSERLEKKRKSELSRVSHESHMEEHIISLEQLSQKLNTDLQKGLNPNLVKHLLDVSGPNIVTTNIPSEEWQRFCKNIFDWFNCFLWVGSILCFITYATEKLTSTHYVFTDDLYLGCVLAGVVSISGSFSYYQEAKSANIFAAFNDLIPRNVTVIRGGSKLICAATELVVGDLIELNAGDRVPADIRIIDSQGLKCVNPLLTGNSEPFIPTNECTDINPLETHNLVFFSTNCIEGSAKGIVVQTGDRTLMSNLLIRFYNEKQNKSDFKSELSQNITTFIRKITIVSVFVGAVMSVTSFFVGYSWLNAVIFMIALVVSQIPEGLYPTVTVALSLAAKRMTAKNCLVKNLETVESIGLTSMIITDKTGVITQNRMIVSHIWANNSIIDSESFYRHSDGRLADLDSPAWRALIRGGCLCNRAMFSAAQTKFPAIRRKAIGNPTEIAVLRYMEILIGCVESYRQNYPKVYEIAFDPNLRFSLSINKFRGGFWLCMKGEPEFIIQRCSTILTMGKIHVFDDYWRNYFVEVIEQLGNFGEIIIAFCDKFLPFDDYPIGYEFNFNAENLKDLRFIGLCSLINPPQPSVPNAIMRCRSAGIKVIMVTGDHPITAKAIARAVGIITKRNQTAEEISERMGIQINEIDDKSIKASVVTGDQIELMDDNQISELLHSDRDVVLARISPNQKSRIVECSYREKDLIAVTGDADKELSSSQNSRISIALGKSGSDVSKQLADIILLDDNFASIVVGIEEGRVIFDNLKKSICYTLSSKTPIVFPFILYITLGIPLALGSITIFCIDLGTDMIPAISLAYELAEVDIMKNKPRDPFDNKLVNIRLLVLSYCIYGMIEMLGAFFTYVVIMTENGFFSLHLLDIRNQWDSKAVNDLMDSYGQEWTYHRRKTLEYTCQTAFFASVVITKWSALLCCKTRRNSLIVQKMKNNTLTFSMIFELGLAVFLSYCPGLDKSINMYPLKFFWWFCSVPFALLMILIEEIRLIICKLKPNGWVEKHSYY